MAEVKFGELRSVVEAVRQIVLDWDGFVSNVEALAREHDEYRQAADRLAWELGELRAAHERLGHDHAETRAARPSGRARGGGRESREAAAGGAARWRVRWRRCEPATTRSGASLDGSARSARRPSGCSCRSGRATKPGSGTASGLRASSPRSRS